MLIKANEGWVVGILPAIEQHGIKDDINDRIPAYISEKRNH